MITPCNRTNNAGPWNGARICSSVRAGFCVAPLEDGIGKLWTMNEMNNPAGLCVVALIWDSLGVWSRPHRWLRVPLLGVHQYECDHLFRARERACCDCDREDLVGIRAGARWRRGHEVRSDRVDRFQPFLGGNAARKWPVAASVPATSTPHMHATRSGPVKSRRTLMRAIDNECLGQSRCPMGTRRVDSRFTDHDCGLEHQLRIVQVPDVTDDQGKQTLAANKIETAANGTHVTGDTISERTVGQLGLEMCPHDDRQDLVRLVFGVGWYFHDAHAGRSGPRMASRIGSRGRSSVMTFRPEGQCGKGNPAQNARISSRTAVHVASSPLAIITRSSHSAT